MGFYKKLVGVLKHSSLSIPRFGKKSHILTIADISPLSTRTSEHVLDERDCTPTRGCVGTPYRKRRIRTSLRGSGARSRVIAPPGPARPPPSRRPGPLQARSAVLSEET
ncbi:hypothetical protein EVAR_81850_1 [Eumeta japonica]|uniref:Uncharacterized protein n=1 Tax=Eumeta variegata TaxID=151549 RepID=A0A4C1XT74_EUMVA|nr:hypothetical protein EVAR_81850_1 [Eumeta japonica]